jgi:hypothetical protein
MQTRLFFSQASLKTEATSLISRTAQPHPDALAKNKIEIRDIKISEILDQYLAYIDGMQEMDLEIASEFVQMASYLLYIKTKTILAGEEEVPELQQLMSSLEQLRCRDLREAIKSVIPEFAAAAEKGLMTFTRAQNLWSHKRGFTITGTIRQIFSGLCIPFFPARMPEHR